MNETSHREMKLAGHKKIAVTKRSIVDDIYSHRLSKKIADGTADSFLLCSFSASDNINLQDSLTGETFFHVLCKYAHHYTCPTKVNVFYMMGTLLDLDKQDSLGETGLHKLCLLPNVWQCIVAVLRCNAFALVKNNAGLTAEELIIQNKKIGWEENLYWLRKFSPSLWELLKDPELDAQKLDRLLMYRCRTFKVVGTTLESLKEKVQELESGLICVFYIEKFENNNEFVFSFIGSKITSINNFLDRGMTSKLDVNALDYSYQYHYLDYPTAPRPLLLAIWAMNNLELVQKYLLFKPNTAIKYTFEADATSTLKPLFFHLVNPKCQPADLEIIKTILACSDLDIRDNRGQTVLFEAVHNDMPEPVIAIILECGVNVAARDYYGRTVWDLCSACNKQVYRNIIDKYIVDLVGCGKADQVESLVLQMYDHLPIDLICPNGLSQFSCQPESEMKMLDLLTNTQCIQGGINDVFTAAKSGDFQWFHKVMNRRFATARDKGGRTLLHCALQAHTLSLNGTPNYTNNCHEREIDKNTISTLNGISDTQTDTTPSCPDKLSQDMQRHHHRESKEVLTAQCKSTKNEFLSIITLLVKAYPFLSESTNNLGQTPLHYAHIFSAGQNVWNMLKAAGNSCQKEDVFGYLPKDYDQSLCGQQTFETRRKSVLEMDLKLFLTESHFDEILGSAIQTGETCKLEPLIGGLMENGGKPYYNLILFDCLDAGRFDVAAMLIHKGFDVDISKQYEVCNPELPLCAMMECSHPVTSLHQRADQVGATHLHNLILCQMKQ